MTLINLTGDTLNLNIKNDCLIIKGHEKLEDCPIGLTKESDIQEKIDAGLLRAHCPQFSGTDTPIEKEPDTKKKKEKKINKKKIPHDDEIPY